MVTRIRMWLRALFDRRRLEAEMDSEMQMHLELETEANIRRGMEPGLARREALLAFHGMDRHKEDYRDGLGTRLIEESWRDLQYAARLARRSPAFTATALLLLALAVGTASAIFSVAYSVLFRSLPYPQPGQLVYIQEGNGGVSWPNFVDWRKRATSFAGMAGAMNGAVIVTARETPLRLNSKVVTANFFKVLGVTAARGRVFDDGDADAAIDALDEAIMKRGHLRFTRVGSTTGIKQQIILGREAVKLLDAVISKQFAADETILAAWASASRVDLKTGSPCGVTPPAPSAAPSA
jgi:hypothetical protein